MWKERARGGLSGNGGDISLEDGEPLERFAFIEGVELLEGVELREGVELIEEVELIEGVELIL